MKTQHPQNETARLAALHNYHILDSAPETSFDDVSLLASQICQTPIAAVTFVDEQRQWFKSAFGTQLTETSRDIAFCAHTILNSGELLEVCDTQLDPRFAENPLVNAAPNIRFYAGAPLISPEGFALGALCVIDDKPHQLSESQKNALKVLARNLVSLLELRKSMAEQTQLLDAMRESEMRFYDLVDNAHDLIQITGIDGNLLYTNRSWQKTLGYSQAETTNLNLQAIVHPSSLAHCMTLFKQVLAEGELVHIEATLQTKSGEEVMIEGNSTCRYKEGKPYSTRSIFRDVTARKRAEEWFRQLVEASPFGIIMISQQGIIMLVSKMAETFFGYTKEELINQPIELLLPERFRQAHPHLRNSYTADAKVRPMGAGRDLYGLRKDGSEFPVEIGLSPLDTSEGKVVMVALVDITERKRMQSALTQFKYTLDQTLDCVFICNLDDFRFTYVNNGAIQQFGYSETELMGMIVPDIKPEFSPEEYRVLIQPLLNGSKASLTFETLHRHKNGRDIPVEVSLQVVLQGTLEPCIISIVRDITERKRVAQILHNKNAELKAFAYTVSHDLKAPLRGISGYAQELERRHKEGLSERAQFCIAQVITASHNLDGLIEDLLLYSRLDSELPTRTSIHLDKLVQSILKDRSHTLAEQAIVVSTAIPPIQLTCWERGLHQVLTNLIDNAIKYSRHATPPRLTITAEETAAGYRLSVADNGVGFDMKYHDRIFGLFNRLVRTDEFEGSGAGLAIVKKLIDKMGGTVFAEATPNQGATFFVEIPHQPI